MASFHSCVREGVYTPKIKVTKRLRTRLNPRLTHWHLWSHIFQAQTRLSSETDLSINQNVFKINTNYQIILLLRDKIKCSGNDSVDLTPRNGAMFSQGKKKMFWIWWGRDETMNVLSFVFLWLPKLCLYSLWMESLNVWVNCKWLGFSK